MDEVANGDGVVVDGHFGEVMADVVIEIEFVLLGEEEDAGGGELFGSGGDVEG